MLSKTGRFRRADRLLRNQDFKRVVKAGKRRVSEHFVVVTAPQKAPIGSCNATEICNPTQLRLGVTVSKRVGNSVVRNRVKRLIREWFRRARPNLPESSDIVVIARSTAGTVAGSEAVAALDTIFPSLRTRSRQSVAAGIQ